MNKQTLYLVVTVAVILLSAYYLIARPQKDSKQNTAPLPQQLTTDTSTTQSLSSENNPQSTTTPNSQNTTTNPTATVVGEYQDYSPDLLNSKQATGQKIVLFFHAKWCPFCRTADTAFLSRINEIPKGVTILKTDFDTTDDLKKKYGVTYQHTFVQIDAQGNKITSWVSGDIEALKQYLK